MANGQTSSASTEDALTRLDDEAEAERAGTVGTIAVIAHCTAVLCYDGSNGHQRTKKRAFRLEDRVALQGDTTMT